MGALSFYRQVYSNNFTGKNYKRFYEKVKNEYYMRWHYIFIFIIIIIICAPN